jgi:dipeptidyl-peptidase-4
MKTLFIALSVCLYGLGPAGNPLRASEEFTLEWILDPENSRALNGPRILWLADETLLLDDASKTQEERALELFDPRTLERRVAGDQQKILEAWKQALGDDRAPEWVGLPSGAAVDSKTLLYQRQGDLFLLDLESGVLRRVTNTEEREVAARFSPDGHRLAYARDNDLYSADVASGRERRLTRDGGPARLNGVLSWVYQEEIMGRREDGFWWSPDSSALLYLQTNESSVLKYPLVDYEPPKADVLWQRYPKAGSVNPTVRAGIVEAGGAGQKHPTESGEGSGTLWIELDRVSKDGTPPEYIARCGWLADSSAAVLVTLNRAQNHLEIWKADRHTGLLEKLFEESSPTWIDLHDDLIFLPGGQRYLWVSERDGYRHLYLHDLEGAPPVQLTSGEWVLKSGHGHGSSRWPGSVAWADAGQGDAGNGFVVFHAANPDPIETHVYRVDLDGGNLTRLSQGGGTRAISFSPGGAYYVERSSRTGVPPQLTLHRADGSLLHVLKASATDLLEPLSLKPPKLFTVPAADGTTLTARLFEPDPVAEGKTYPAIVYIYGGPGRPAVSDRWTRVWYLWSQLLAKRGFAVFTVDPRSASDQGRAREDTIFRRFYGAGELEDILAGVRYLKGLPFVDPQRVGIWGWSGGGSNTLYAMTHSKEFRAGIAVAGVADWSYYDTIYTERYMGHPDVNEEGYRASSAAQAAKDLHGRLLLVHGTGDNNVHPQNAIRFADELIAAGKQFDFMLYPRRGHGIHDPAARQHLFRLMLDFWERNLKGATIGGEAAVEAGEETGAQEASKL